MKWFRMYHEMIDDPKIGTLSDSQFRTWVEILCLACRAENEGNTNMTVSETEWQLRRNVSETFQELQDRGLVTLQKNGKGKETICVTKWKKRQYLSDCSSDRVREYRKRQSCNGDEAFQ